MASAIVAADSIWKAQLAGMGLAVQEHAIDPADAFELHTLMQCGALEEVPDVALPHKRALQGDMHVLVGASEARVAETQAAFEKVLALTGDWTGGGWRMSTRLTAEMKHLAYPGGAKSAPLIAYEARFRMRLEEI